MCHPYYIESATALSDSTYTGGQQCNVLCLDLLFFQFFVVFKFNYSILGVDRTDLYSIKNIPMRI